MIKKLNILFVAWDSPDVKYLEGLFVPIFHHWSLQWGHSIHILHFSWSDSARQHFLTEFCKGRGINYTPVQVSQRPVAAIGKFFTTLKGTSILKRYIQENKIDVVMPRSTMPARMLLPLLSRSRSFKVLFDADGLPIEERVDFAGLKPRSYRYKSLKAIEKGIITAADAVLTRTEKAAVYLSEQYHVPLSKFNVVRNGSDRHTFKFSPELRQTRRKELGVPPEALLLVYSGSLGPQYGVEQMFLINKRLRARDIDSRLLILTNHPHFLSTYAINPEDQIFVRSVEFSEIPGYLSSGDLGFAIRKDTHSMQGVAPIKVGEYLLNGLPIVASARIGDSRNLLAGQPFIHLLEDYSEHSLNEAIQWIEESVVGSNFPREQPTAFGSSLFSIEVSAETYQNAIVSLS